LDDALTKSVVSDDFAAALVLANLKHDEHRGKPIYFEMKDD